MVVFLHGREKPCSKLCVLTLYLSATTILLLGLPWLVRVLVFLKHAFSSSLMSQ